MIAIWNSQYFCATLAIISRNNTTENPIIRIRLTEQTNWTLNEIWDYKILVDYSPQNPHKHRTNTNPKLQNIWNIWMCIKPGTGWRLMTDSMWTYLHGAKFHNICTHSSVFRRAAEHNELRCYSTTIAAVWYRVCRRRRRQRFRAVANNSCSNRTYKIAITSGYTGKD